MVERTKTPITKEKDKAPKPPLPDAINCTTSSEFTQIPNKMLRSPELSAKAKGILCLLLSNKKGWCSYVKVIEQMMTDGRESIQSGLSELEEIGYLIRLHYREKNTKKYRGVMWCYTDNPNEFDMEEAERLLEEGGFEIFSFERKKDEKPVNGFPVNGSSVNGSSVNGKPVLNNTNSKNTNSKNTNMNKKNNENQINQSKNENLPLKEKRITPSMFEKFWELYPRKIDKGKAKTKWEQICKKPSKERPTWKEVAKAIIHQKKSGRWQNKTFIPHPTTWLNQQRWLDDPAEMNDSYDTGPGTKPEKDITQSPKKIIRRFFKNKEMTTIFYDSCFAPAKKLFADIDGNIDENKLAEKLLDLFSKIAQAQEKNLSEELRWLLPAAVPLVENYILWLSDNSWITNMSIDILDTKNILFGKFRRAQAECDNMERDPLTGESYIRG